MYTILRAIFQNKFAFWTLTVLDLKKTVVTTRLGWVWWILDPIIMMFIYYFMVVTIFHRGGPNYHFFALSGIVSWQYFTRTLKLTATSIKRNRQLISLTSMPLELYTTIPVFVQSIFALIGYAIIIIWTMFDIHFDMLLFSTNPMAAFAPYIEHLTYALQLFPIACVISLYAYFLGLCMGIWSVFLSDISKFVDYGLRAGFFLTPILYPASRVYDSPYIPSDLKFLYSLNPMTWAIESVRTAILDLKNIDLIQLAYFLLVGLVLCQLALFSLNALRANILKRI